MNKSTYPKVYLSRFFLLFFFCCYLSLPTGLAQPTGFSDQIFMGGWNQATGFTWDTNGRMYVWEKRGMVWIVENGVKLSTPLIDIREEVGNWRDFGLLGFALDPNFLSNGYIYLFYVVDRHHLMNYGTPDYNPSTNEYYNATIGRITRYQAQGSSFNTVDYNSRTILLGESPSTGCPILHESHGVGHLVFGEDGSLMATMGDGASYSSVDEGSAPETYWQQALQDNIITSAENVGAYRCQMLSSHNGKMFRLDPASGDGLPSNPFYNASDPRSAQSRTWGMGLRNAYRFCKVPDTGSHIQSDGDPGVFIFGDVGWGNREEMSFVTAPAQNFGWPKWEGMTNMPGYNDPDYEPANHKLPTVDWRNGAPRVTVNGNIQTVGTEFPGPTFQGNASTGGIWYTGTDFPPEYQNTYFQADYGGGWVRNFVFDQDYNPTEIRNFISNGGAIVFVNTHPTQGGLYYIKYNSGSEIRKVSYTGDGNNHPVAIAEADVISGNSPLTVNFTGDQSYDPDLTPITYFWDFGDGTNSTDANPTHIFDEANGTQFLVTLSVTDADGGVGEATILISINNTPPIIESTSIDNVNTFPLGTQTILPLNAVVSDLEDNPSTLTFAWQTFLFHNDHSHPEAVDNNPTTSVVLSPVGCDGNTYWYRITLTVTDPGGLSATYQKDIFPDCPGLSQTIDFPPIPDQTILDGPITLNASASSGLPIVYYLVEGPAILSGNVVNLTGTPGEVTINATQPGDGTYAPAQPVFQSFNVSTPPPGNCSADGFISREVWTGIPGVAVSDIPVNDPPDISDQLDIFEIPVDVMNEYGTRLRGFICPPISGQYVFWISSDDNGELWLSTNNSPANKVLVASVPGWTNSRQWDKYSQQQSAPIPLIAGQEYYIEALMKEQGGGDNLAVRWQLPSGTMEEPIPGLRLSPWGLLDQTITYTPVNDKVVSELPFDVDVSASSGLPVAITVESGPATISGNTVTLTGETGTVTLRYSQGGNEFYNPATDVLDEFEVYENPIVEINAPVEGATVLGEDIEVQYTITGEMPPGYHLHLIVDGPPHITIMDLSGSYTIPAVPYGAHTLTAELVTSDHQPLPHPEATDVVNFTNEEPAGLTLSAELQGRSDHSGEYVVRLYQNGSSTLVYDLLATADSDGLMSTGDIQSGTYDIYLKHGLFLARIQNGITLNIGSNSLDFTSANDLHLLAGDANNDNVVNIQDFSILGTAFNTIPGDDEYNENADFNSNDAVNISDFSLLSTNFSQIGDLPPDE